MRVITHVPAPVYVGQHILVFGFWTTRDQPLAGVITEVPEGITVAVKAERANESASAPAIGVSYFLPPPQGGVTATWLSRRADEPRVDGAYWKPLEEHR